MRHLKIGGICLIALSLFFFRFQNLSDMGLELWIGIRAGAWRGFLEDFSWIFGVLALGQLTRALGLRRLSGGFVRAGFLLALLGAFGDVLHFRYFHSPLELWVVLEHLGDGFAVRKSAGVLSQSSFIFLGGSVGLLGWCSYSFAPSHPLEHGWPRGAFWGSRLKGLILLVCVTSGVLLSSPGSRHESQVFDSQIFIRWARDFGREMLANSGGEGSSHLKQLDQDARYLAGLNREDYSEIQEGAGEASWPLARELKVDESETRAFRKALGLPEKGPINIFFVFIESGRALEFWHPVLGRRLFPELRQLLSEKGISFQQAYSGAFKAGQTVRGQFSTLCSMYPDPLGPAPTISNPRIKVNCLADLAKNNHYKTTWFNAHEKTFNKKDIFESLHGTQAFYDKDWFIRHGVPTSPPQQFGLRDRPFLQETLRELKSIDASGGPIFANILTTTSHHPSGWIPEAGLTPQQIDELLGEVNSPARDYGSVLRYVDLSVSEFIRGVIGDPVLGPNSLVVLLGDHSHSHSIPDGLSSVSKVESLFRIPMALITRGMTQPRVFQQPVHQVDLALLVSKIAGLQGNVSWVGRTPLRVEHDGVVYGQVGSPWVYPGLNGETQFRRGSHLCVDNSSATGVECYEVPDGTDPLYWTTAEVKSNRVSFQASPSNDMLRVLEATHSLVTHDALLPRQVRLKARSSP